MTKPERYLVLIGKHQLKKMLEELENENNHVAFLYMTKIVEKDKEGIIQLSTVEYLSTNKVIKINNTK
jgi:hypothetical protein